MLDIAVLAAAPWTAAYLGEFGADVIKVEQPRIGDHQRRWGSQKNGHSVFWRSIGRNKRSITLDLRHPRGADLLKRLVSGADVLIENFRPGTLERWGLGYEALSAINPGLIMLRVTGFGQTGPYRHRPGFGTLAEAFSGFSHLTGEPDGPPTLPNLPLADGVAGIVGAYAVMLALYQRDQRDGLGQVIDVSLIEPLLRLLEPALLEWDQFGISLMRTGNRMPHVAPRNVYRCRDGNWVALSASTQPIFERLVRAIGRPEMLTDPRFIDNRARVVHAEELDEVIHAWMAERTRAEVLQTMEQAEVAVGPVNDVPTIFEDRHLRERGTFIEVDDPGLGPMRLVGPVARLSRTPGRITSTGPAVPGQHNAEVYAEVGVGPEELAELCREGIV